MNTNMMRFAMCIGLCVLLIGGVTGCRSKKPVTVAPPSTGTESTVNTGLPPVDLNALDFSPYAELKKVYFDYNDFSLRPDAREALKFNAEIIKNDGGLIVRVEGNCDERGTQEYNLSLGEKRALSVREYLIQLGVSGDRLITISYGEEVPADPGHSEAAWSQNRRAEFSKASKK